MSAASQHPSEHLITAAQLAIRWGVALNTLSQWRAAGTGPAFLRLGGGERPRIRYRLADVQAYERRQLENRP